MSYCARISEIRDKSEKRDYDLPTVEIKDKYRKRCVV